MSVKYEDRYQRVLEGLNLMLDQMDRLGELGYYEPFPRTVATSATRIRQYSVDTKERAMFFFQASMYEDCYLNAYPDYNRTFESLNQKYYGPEAPNYYPSKNWKPKPNHILIDIDRDSFISDEEFKTAVRDTLANCRELILGSAGAYPTVVATGNGKHIHVPLLWSEPLEDILDFANFKDQIQDQNNLDLATRFIRWAESRLSNGKSDQRHNPSVYSCLFRVPGTINTKARAKGRDPEVKLLQSWTWIEGTSTSRGRGRVSNKLLMEFHSSLVQQVIDSKVEKLERKDRRAKLLSLTSLSTKNNPCSINWIDRLLKIGIDDNRKNVMFWVLAPYLVTVRGLDYDNAYHVIEAWLEKCDEIRSLEPSWTDFRYRIRYCLDTAENQERKPIRFETFKEYYPEVYNELLAAEEKNENEKG